MELQVQEAHRRLDVYLTEKLPQLSRSRIGALIKEGAILVNGQSCKAGLALKAGDVISLELPHEEEPSLRPERMPLDIIYEDEDLLVVNKPSGLVVHPGAGNWEGTLVNALLAHCKNLSQMGGTWRPGIVHRLDKDTSGLLMVAKNDAVHRALKGQLQRHLVKREYRALVHGQPPDKGTIDAPIGRHPVHRMKMAVLPVGQGRQARTHFQVLETFPKYSLLACLLETGRTHQIRVHLAYINHPVVGDPLYGYRRESLLIEGQALHAAILGFHHPRTGRYLEFAAPLPEKMENLLKILRGDCQGDVQLI
ncbi:MAG: RluA family pseudouridine synthase [Limnochordia bacterium]|jgi:23S rRNA pseudouridine1911/1915/1917 synthase